jgi:hypothetical protein
MANLFPFLGNKESSKAGGHSSFAAHLERPAQTGCALTIPPDQRQHWWVRVNRYKTRFVRYKIDFVRYKTRFVRHLPLKTRDFGQKQRNWRFLTSRPFG